MNEALLDVLRCPFCGGALELADEPVSRPHPGAIATAILTCDCGAYPVVEGIPCMRAVPPAEEAMQLIGAGEPHRAACLMLGLGEDQDADLDRLKGDRATFRIGLSTLGRRADTSYAFFRFSDPTFLASEAVVRAVAPRVCGVGGRALDLCGGSGHLTRSLVEAARGAEVVLADISFWELWLAKRFVAPSCEPVWCDANAPLPFARDAFGVVLCSDAFHYVWSRRLLAREMFALVGDEGAILVPHLHNADSWNYSEGMPLRPERYRELFDRRETRLFEEAAILDARLAGRPVDLSGDRRDDELRDAPALTLVSTSRQDVFRALDLLEDGARPGTARRLALNPLYAEVERKPPIRALELRFPSEGYEMEYGEAARRYLPQRVEIADDDLRNGSASARVCELVGRRVLLDLPDAYL